MFSAYIYLAKIRLLSVMTYRFDFLFSFFSNVIILFTSVFLWKAAYGDTTQAADVNLDQMITYTIMSSIIAIFYTTYVQNKMLYKIRIGSISLDLSKPIHILAMNLAEDLGDLAASLLNKAAPILLVALIFFEISVPDFKHFLFFLLSIILGYSIIWLMNALVGLIAFWTMELGNVGTLMEVVIRIFSGSIVPLWFFPEGFQKVISYFPFQYIYQTPLGIYIGVYQADEAWRGILIQAVWILVLLSLLVGFWRFVSRRLVVQGG